MIEVLIVLGVVYGLAALALCGWIGHEMAGRRGLALGVLFGPLGVMICALLRLTDQLGTDLRSMEEAIGHLDHAMASIMPWGRSRPRRPPA